MLTRTARAFYFYPVRAIRSIIGPTYRHYSVPTCLGSYIPSFWSPPPVAYQVGTHTSWHIQYVLPDYDLCAYVWTGYGSICTYYAMFVPGSGLPQGEKRGGGGWEEMFLVVACCTSGQPYAWHSLPGNPSRTRLAREILFLRQCRHQNSAGSTWT